MIRNEAELAVVRDQMTRLEVALISLRREVLPTSEARFYLMAEAYVGQLLDLRAAYDEFLGLNDVEEADADLVIGIDGAGIELGNAPLSVLVQTLDRVRRGVQKLLHARVGEQQISHGRRPKWIEQLSDLAIRRLSPGSIRVHLSEPPEAGLFEEQHLSALRDTVHSLVKAAAWSSGQADPPVMADDDWHVTLSVLRSIAPPKRGAIRTVSLAGRMVGSIGEVTMGRAARERIDSELRRLAIEEQVADVFGVIREIDLDKRTFSLRQRGGEPDLACEYDEAIEDEVKALLDQPVVAFGVVRTSRKTQKHTMEVEFVETVPEESDEADDASSAKEEE